MIKKFIPLFVALFILVMAGFAMWDEAGKQHEDVSYGEASIGGPFTLTDQNGVLRSDSEFRGKLMLVYFGFTYCPDICPTDLSVMARAVHKLGDDAESIAPIFITIDPERDTVEQLNSYLSHFNAPIIGFTGDTEPAIKAYRVYAKKVQRDDLNDYTMDHSAYFYLMDEDGRYITHFAHNTDPTIIASEIRSML